MSVCMHNIYIYTYTHIHIMTYYNILEHIVSFHDILQYKCNIVILSTRILLRSALLLRAILLLRGSWDLVRRVISTLIRVMPR